MFEIVKELGEVSLESAGAMGRGTSSVCSLCMAAAVTVSLVWEESISAVRVWYRFSFAGDDLQYRSSHPIVSTGAIGLRSRIFLMISYIASQFEGG